MIYDLIGDIHGFITPLRSLLKKLNYIQINDYLWQPPQNHQAIFIGDYIDRGADSVAVLKTVRAMVDEGYAIALLGNHEYNAINYHTLKKDHEHIDDERYKYLRSHNEKHRKQHQATLDDFKRHSEPIQPFIEWFYTLPLIYETVELIAIHACPVVKYLKALNDHPDIVDNHLTEDFIFKASGKGSLEDNIIENLLKGVEYPLPDNLFFHDKDGNERKDIRLNWWDLNDDNKRITNWNELALTVPVEAMEKMEKRNLEPEEITKIRADVQIPTGKKIFIGHYWLTGDIKKKTEKVVCIDYSIAKGGKLVCYSFTSDLYQVNQFFTSAE